MGPMCARTLYPVQAERCMPQPELVLRYFDVFLVKPRPGWRGPGGPTPTRWRESGCGRRPPRRRSRCEPQSPVMPCPTESATSPSSRGAERSWRPRARGRSAAASTTNVDVTVVVRRAKRGSDAGCASPRRCPIPLCTILMQDARASRGPPPSAPPQPPVTATRTRIVPPSGEAAIPAPVATARTPSRPRAVSASNGPAAAALSVRPRATRQCGRAARRATRARLASTGPPRTAPPRGAGRRRPGRARRPRGRRRRRPGAASRASPVADDDSAGVVGAPVDGASLHLGDAARERDSTLTGSRTSRARSNVVLSYFATTTSSMDRTSRPTLARSTSPRRSSGSTPSSSGASEGSANHTRGRRSAIQARPAAGTRSPSGARWSAGGEAGPQASASWNGARSSRPRGAGPPASRGLVSRLSEP